MIKKPIKIIGSASGWGAKKYATRDGPDTIQQYELVEKLCARQLNVAWQQTLYLNHQTSEPKDKFALIAQQNKKLAKAVAECIKANNFPLTIGGDHSMAVGTWSGLTTAFNATQQFGLIWIDAHMDAHTLETSPSMAYHGMPVACLLGHGVPELINIGSKGAKIKPEHIVLIGVRSYESGEAALLQKLGVRVFKMQEVQQRGFKAVMSEALGIVTNKTKGFGLSVDLDGFDPTEAPGVGSPVPKGLLKHEVLPVLQTLIAPHAMFKALEIAEYNPQLDKKFLTAQLIVELAESLLL